MAGETEHSDGGTASVRPGALSALLQELAAAAPSVSEPGAWDGGLRAGAVIGRFELVRELGRGGFGVVWEAKDRELGRRVAFKAVRPGARRDLREERLLREAEAAAQLSHPNIVTLHDVGRSDSGPYLVLELLEGKTLAERLGEGGLTPREAVHVGGEVARGLAHAHGHGVVHRDLKPENVFLCRDGRVKVLDFGLAHAFGHRRQAGGTGGYMAPEQVEGAPEDERTDVWALGVMLFEMLSGRRPFAEEATLRKPAPALEVPGLPRLGELVTRMLAARPVDRPRDAGEVLEAVAAIEQEFSRASAPVAGEVRTRRRPRPPRGALVVAGIVLSAFIAAAGWWAHAHRTRLADASAPVALAVLPLANLSGDDAQDYFSDGMTEEITGKLSRLGGLAVTPRSSVKKYKGSSKDAREIGNELRVAYLVEGSVRRAGDRIRVSATLVNTADAVQLWSDIIDARLDDVFQVQEQVATRIVEALHVRLSPDEADSLRRWGTRNAAAYDEFLRGEALADRISVREKLEAARRHFERALQMDSSFAPAMAGLAFVEGTIYRVFDATPERLTKARALLDRALAIDPKLPRALISSGLMRALVYDYRGGAEDFRRALVVEPRNFGFWDFLCWALGYTNPPELAEAEKACRRSIELNPSYAEAYYHLARVLVQQGRVREAEQAIEYLAEQSPESNFVPSGRFWVHLGARRPREAIAALERTPGQFAESGLAKSWRSMALAQAGDLDGALAALEQALGKGYRDAAQLHGDPFFEPLRRDRRFAPLLAKYGLPPSGSAGGQTGATKR